MLIKLIYLNSIAGRFRPRDEYLSSQTRNWYTDGYRVSNPTSNLCNSTVDCEANQICQSGVCTELPAHDSYYTTHQYDQYNHTH